MTDFKIYIAFHRNGGILPEGDLYMPLQVGKKNRSFEMGIQNDAEGVSISEKNEFYSELTGWYWIWKNRKHDYVGTAHYRRYFTASPVSFLRKTSKLLLFLVGMYKKRIGLLYVGNPEKWKQKILSIENIESIMKDNDVILPQKKKFKYTVKEQYKRRHRIEDVILTRKIIENKYPDYIDSFDETFNGCEMYPFNMFVMPWHLFDAYMEWLFDILGELESKTTTNTSDIYQKRVGAFMAERLQTVWFQKNKRQIKELPVLYFKKLKAEHF